MNFSPKTTLVQTQTLSQTQLQSLKILSLDNFELNNFLQNEYIENPLLDYNENSNLPSWNQYVSYSSAKEDEDIYKEIPDFSENGIKEFLLDQLTQRNFSDLQWTAMQTMIDCLDDCGYFKLSLKDFSQWFGIDISTVKYCLDILSSLEPLGIFSKDLPHCLLRQLEARQELTPELNQIIRYHLDDIAAGKINTITQKLSMSTQDVRKCIAKIRELNPRPISGFLTNSTDYIVPDILIDYQDSSWIIRLNDQWIGNYSLCDYYLNMMHTSQSPELKEYFRKKYNRVQLIMHSIEQRRPKDIFARSVKLSNGFEGMGSVFFDYGDFQAEVVYSKITDSFNPSVITGEDGYISIGKLSMMEYADVKMRNGSEETLFRDRFSGSSTNMVYEVGDFEKAVRGELDVKKYHEYTEETLKIIDEIRKQNGIDFGGSI